MAAAESRGPLIPHMTAKTLNPIATLPVNLASQRVMEKLRFRYGRDFEFAGLVHRFYRLVKGEGKG